MKTKVTIRAENDPIEVVLGDEDGAIIHMTLEDGEEVQLSLQPDQGIQIRSRDSEFPGSDLFSAGP
ncbi:hypothetical protein EB061_03665 [bacterium]|nr:hypothetical protein [bacterium]